MKDIKLHAKGVRYVNWDWRTPDGQHKRAAWREIPLYRQIWSFVNAAKGSSQKTLEPGNYEFPFSISLHRSMPVSIEGLEDCYIQYGLTATIFRGHGGRVTTSRNMSVSRSQSHLALPEPEVRTEIFLARLRVYLDLSNSHILQILEHRKYLARKTNLPNEHARENIQQGRAYQARFPLRATEEGHPARNGETAAGRKALDPFVQQPRARPH